MKNKKVVLKRKFKLFKLHKFTYFVILLDLLVIAGAVVVYTPIVSFKNFWIPTAMTTMSHRYLAYTLYSEDSVNEVMSENYIVSVNENVNLDDIVIDPNSGNKHYTSKYEQDMFNKDEDNDLRKYKYYLENKGGKKMKLIGTIMYTGTIFYFVFTILKLFKFI